ncbi:MerR family transcriptional regulator [Paenibacillus lutrae]|uniref:MerR family transcriptional regulator n=1 Tax=Paenibacillus lutrae TaxID=2078573 RepID=A0A7X3FF67_9BACL|nr:MerR family transcriptional regulator [Paenibacillus lutrae]MVO98529.1 MerR family transcriptional regulator [Paenibacillus lutrae]
MKLYKIGELSRIAGVSPRTIDYYTKLGLLHPEKRSDNNYRFYSDETLLRLKRIEDMKKEKYTLEEIRTTMLTLDKAVHNDQVTDKLTNYQVLLGQLQREIKELDPMIQQLKPNQLKKIYNLITQPTAACAEALLYLLGKGPFT